MAEELALPLAQESQGNLVLPTAAMVADGERNKREEKEKRGKVVSAGRLRQ